MRPPPGLDRINLGLLRDDASFLPPYLPPLTLWHPCL